MIKEAIDKIAGMAIQAALPQTIEIKDKTYYVKRDGELFRIRKGNHFAPDKMGFNTLTGLVDYINTNIDEHDWSRAVLVVNDPLLVTLETAIDKEY